MGINKRQLKTKYDRDQAHNKIMLRLQCMWTASVV
jgi:hypothetical protein